MIYGWINFLCGVRRGATGDRRQASGVRREALDMGRQASGQRYEVEVEI